MQNKSPFFAACVILLFASASVYAQAPLISFDQNEGKWALSLMEPNVNSIKITDNFVDVKEGNGSMEVTVALRNYGASWGTWTDFKYDFPAPVDFKDADEFRFWVKLLDRPTQNRTLQFTCDFFDQPQGAPGSELWRYMNGTGDRDIFYNSNTDWFEVVVPFSRLRLPGWFSPVNGTFDKNAVVGFGFGVHGDNTAADSVRFLIDNLYLAKSQRTASIFNFDQNEGKWGISLMEPNVNSIVLRDNFVDVAEGNGALEVEVKLRHFGASWGTWTDAKMDFSPPIDLTGATEFRFMMKVVTPPSNPKKALQFTADLFDQPAGAAGSELWRWPAQYGLFYGPDNQSGWVEIVVPFKDMSIPGWFSPVNGQFDLSSIVTFAFGVHGDSTAADSVVVLFDDLHATNGTFVPTAVKDRPGSHIVNAFRLEQNYPNPFNPTTKINFVLDKAGSTSLKIYNTSGQLVQTVFENANKLPGSYSFEVDMSHHPSGMYFYVLEQGNRKLAKKMTLMK
ncbi:MAG: T9SS type A sorting domain-containing protein [candidate division KSB1 bacterium]|nr:T9SS type A sorting domain-containing protein [candidate division KSB1 bacterium]MDZ7302865.1 T9SS type A sorting domain-containing protein [candidate division KSB1 bacterium]MDZ7310440.1 T9SS type A sorting domain-containing protein [candidate division KSB1 bacterium]